MRRIVLDGGLRGAAADGLGGPGMDLPDLVVRGSRVVTAAGTGPASVHVRDGVIVEVAGYDDVPGRGRVIEAGAAAVMPGVVDTHVHVNEPGRTGWEGFSSATRAAVAGGVTTIVDMPLNSVPATTSLAALGAKRSAAGGKCHVDVGFWGGVVPGNLAELEPMAAAGVLGFKAFLVDSGVPEFAAVREDELGAAMAALARLDALTIVHAEAPDAIAAAARDSDGADPRAYRTWLRSRPDRAETEAVATVAALAQRLGARAHVLHLSSAEALEPLRRARAAGARVSAETCPHYLALAAESVPDGATAFKCAPPIRSAANRERLWAALEAGDLSLVASDHSPSPPDRKHLDDGDFMAAWGGISSLQLALPVVWTAARARGHTLADLAQWMSAAPARLVGLDGAKGAIATGRDADLVLFDPDARFTVDPSSLYHRHPVTPYAGLVLHGVVRATYLRGRVAWDGRRFAGRPLGRLLAREAPG
jgi:allantoinase